MKSVVEYFQEMYDFTIQHSHLPCLQVGNQKKANYLPMEVGTSHHKILTLLSYLYCFFSNFFVKHGSPILQACKIVEGQRYTKRLNEKQITALLKVTCQRPRDRENDILQVMLYSCMSFKFLKLFQEKYYALRMQTIFFPLTSCQFQVKNYALKSSIHGKNLRFRVFCASF